MKRLGWWMIIAFLLFLPFELMLQRTLNLSRNFLWIDEIFITSSFIFFFPFLLYRKGIDKVVGQMLSSFLIFAIFGMISGLYNTSSYIVTLNGIFDYLKNFLVIPVFYLLSIDRKRIQSLHGVLHRLALFLCFIAILQESFFFLGLPLKAVGIRFADVRFGFMRTPSLMGHPNIFGLYSLLFFVLDFALNRRIRWQNLVLGLGVLLSISRMVWAAFFSVLFLFMISKQGKKAAGLFILALIILFLAFPRFYSHTSEEIIYPGYFREYVLMKSLKIWSHRPILGVGPGMYGGVVSFMFDSPVYGQYGFSERWLNIIKEVLSLDQFWPQILAEMGLVGVLGFALMLFILWRIAKTEFLSDSSFFRKNMLLGFSNIPLILAIYLLGSGLNLTAFLLTYSILFGITLGMKDENTSSK